MTRNMNLRLSRNCIRSLELTAKWSSIFCITPWWAFRKQSSIEKHIYKCYTVLLTCLIIFLQGVLVYLRLRYRITNVIYLLTDANNILFWIFSCLGTAFWNMSAWKRIFKIFHGLEKDCLHKSETRVTSIISNINFIFLLANVNFAILIIFLLVVNSGTDHNIFEVLFFTYLLAYYYLKFLLSNLICIIVIFIKYKYERMNEIITRFFDLDKRERLRDIRKTKQLLLVMDKTVHEFNHLFAWPMLFQFFDLVLDSLAGIQFVLSISEKSYISPSVKAIWLYILISKVRKYSCLF